MRTLEQSGKSWAALFISKLFNNMNIHGTASGEHWKLHWTEAQLEEYHQKGELSGLLAWYEHQSTLQEYQTERWQEVFKDCITKIKEKLN